MSSSPQQIFEVFGVYFANCYWNNLYNSALDNWHNEQRETLDDAYQTTISRYNLAFCKKTDPTEKYNKHYVSIVRDIYKNYREYLGVSCTYDQFINTVVQTLIPQSMSRELHSSARKDNLFREVVSKTLTQFTLFVSQEGIGDVVNSKIRKSPEANVKVQTWKRKFIELLAQEKNRLCNILLARSSGVDIRNAAEISIPKQVCDVMNTKIKELCDDLARLTSERNNYARLAAEYKKIIIQDKKLIAELQTERVKSQPTGGGSPDDSDEAEAIEVIDGTGGLDGADAAENSQQSDAMMEDFDFGGPPPLIADD
jgi:hypothetical protein